MTRFTRRELIAALGAWALGRAAGARTGELERALARSTVTLDAMPIYLTFDDGVETVLARGETGATLDVLDILDARGVPATFFVQGGNTGLDEGVVLARMLRNGHRIGNHCFVHEGMRVDDAPAPAAIARQYLDTEVNIRQALEPFPDELAFYLSPDHPHLFRRPGGGYDHAEGNLFLLAEGGYRELFAYNPDLTAYRGILDWLDGVYDYSGWHVEALPLRATIDSPDQVVWWTIKGPGGLDAYRHPPADQPDAVARAALEGVIILLHDPDPRVAEALPLLLGALTARGARYEVLPRPVDRPNRYTVGIGRPPEVVVADA